MRYSPSVAYTPASSMVREDGSICAQRTQLTEPEPGLQAMVCAIQMEPLRYSASCTRQSLPCSLALVPLCGASSGEPASTPVKLSRSKVPVSTSVFAPNGSAQVQTP